MSSVIGDSLNSTGVIQIWIENDCFEPWILVAVLKKIPT